MGKDHYKIFLVDDDTKHLVMLKSHLEKKSEYDLRISIFSSGENCLEKMHEKPDMIILDYWLDGIKSDAANGLEILKKIRNTNPDAYVIMMSGQDNVRVAIDTIDHGAYDYVIKGESAYLRVQMLIDHIIERINDRLFRQDQRRKELMFFGVIILLILIIIFLAFNTKFFS
ncbi:MAG: response regulator [Fimbriimonadaceae bacterium]|nr:response regulator [Chitinophagales bacterium]